MHHLSRLITSTSALAPHSVEMPYIFGSLEHYAIPQTQQERDMASRMAAYWTNFARTGNPNGPGLPHWPEFESRAQKVMKLGGDFGTVPIPHLEELEAIDRVYAFSRFALEYWHALLAVVLTIIAALITGCVAAARYGWRRLRHE